MQVPVHVPRHVEGASGNFFLGAQDGIIKSVRIGSTIWPEILKKLRRETIFTFSSVVIISNKSLLSIYYNDYTALD